MKRRTNSVFVLGSVCGAAVMVAASAMLGVGAGNAEQVFVTAGHDGRTAHAWVANEGAIRYVGSAEATKKKDGAKDEGDDKSGDKTGEKEKGKGKGK